MKKGCGLLLAMLCCVLLLRANGAAADTPIGTEMEVVRCEEYVTLRNMADKKSKALTRLPLGTTVVLLSSQVVDGFYRVGTEEGTGYVLEEYLEARPDERLERAVSQELTQEQRYNVNLFLSYFTEGGFASATGFFEAGDEKQMVDFAVEHIWFNQHEKVERFEMEWIDDKPYNVRVDKELVRPVCEKYFGYAPRELSSDYYDEVDGFFRWMETGGHGSDEFAQVTSVSALGDDRYAAYFESYGSYHWMENDCCHMTIDEVREEYPPYHIGYAEIVAEDLDDRSTYKLLRYVISDATA